MEELGYRVVFGLAFEVRRYCIRGIVVERRIFRSRWQICFRWEEGYSGFDRGIDLPS